MLPIDFMGQGALIEPVDRKLHDAAVDFCNRELQNGKELNLTKLSKVWVGLKGDEIAGVAGYVTKIDIPIIRATDEGILLGIIHRMNDFFCDNGMRGQEVLLHISRREKPEQRCPGWADTMRLWGLESADRFSVKVR